jgi:hypothetical protein
MPLGKEGSLMANEVYALTAFLLYKHDIIKEDEVMNSQSLPKVKMPNRDGFALPESGSTGRQGSRAIPTSRYALTVSRTSTRNGADEDRRPLVQSAITIIRNGKSARGPY